MDLLINYRLWILILINVNTFLYIFQAQFLLNTSFINLNFDGNSLLKQSFL